MRALCLLLVVLFMCFAADTNAISAKLIYKGLNETDKKYFLRYLLGQGYEEAEKPFSSKEFNFPEDLRIPDDIVRKFELYDITPYNFPENFYYNFKKTFNLTTAETLGWARGEIICLPSGECIDTGDAGSVCCT